MGHSKKKREEAALTHCLVARRGFRYQNQFQKQNIPSRSHNSRYKVAPPRILFALQRPAWSACTRRRIPSLLARCNGEKIVSRVRQSIVRFNTLSRYHIPPSLSLSLSVSRTLASISQPDNKHLVTRLRYSFSLGRPFFNPRLLRSFRCKTSTREM